MNMKRATVQFQIEAELEFMVPMGANLAKVEKLAESAVKKEAGRLSSDLTGWNVTWVEQDQG